MSSQLGRQERTGRCYTRTMFATLLIVASVWRRLQRRGGWEGEIMSELSTYVRSEVPPMPLFSRGLLPFCFFLSLVPCVIFLFFTVGSNLRRSKLHSKMDDLSQIENLMLCICIWFVALRWFLSNIGILRTVPGIRTCICWRSLR